MPTSTTPYALVVDDDPIILLNACEILEAAGFRFFDAGDADEAMEVLAGHAESVTLLFSDVEMPGNMNGFALARHVHERWPEIAIVIASGRLAPDDGDLPPGATFIGKPFSEATVHDHLCQILPDGAKPEPLKRAV